MDHLLDKPVMTLETITKLSVSSVYALRNRFKDRIQILGSMNTLVHLGRMIQEIQTSGEYIELKNDLLDIDIVLLETGLEIQDLKVRTSHWIQEYKKSGYTMYKDLNPVRYTLETLLEYKEGRMCYCLYLKNRGSDRKLIGIFDRKSKLTSFVTEHYRDGRVSAIVYDASVLVYIKRCSTSSRIVFTILKIY